MTHKGILWFARYINGERVYVQAEYDIHEVEAWATRAAQSKSGRAVTGPFRFRVVKNPKPN